jgi:tripartite-type tricarboxylate transporter receptor subunit TctC
MRRGHMKRRTFLHVAAGAAVLPVLPRIARAQTYPRRPVRIIVGFAPGGPQDIVARLMGQWLASRLGQQFVIENRTGAAGNIAAEAVARSPADGYTLHLTGLSNAVNASLYDTLSFNFIRDLTPIAGIMRTPGVMEVNPSFPATTVAEFIDLAKANPGKISMGTSGSGSPQHIYGELFKVMAGVSLVFVPYRGSTPVLADLIGGQLQMTIDPIPASLEYIRTGRLRALAVTTAVRSAALPNVATMSEFLPGYEASSWYGMAAPRNTPAEIINTLNMEINAALADTKMKGRLADLGASGVTGSPADFEKLIADETEKWGKVIRAANIKPE